MKIGYEQIVENKQSHADTHLNGISLYRFCYWLKEHLFFVKQSAGSGTHIHKRWGITGFLRGKTPHCIPVFCERNE